MSMASSSSIVVAHNSAVFSGTRSQALSWNPISRLAVSKRKSDELSFWAAKKTVLRHTTRKSFVVSANTAPGVPPAAAPPPSSKPMSWILGLVVSFILPFFTNKWGPLWVIKNKLENAVQTVENIVEAVEKVADSVDKIAEDIADDLPEGSKLRDLVEKVESLAEKTAKTADSLDDVIDKVQEAGDHVDDIVCATKAESDLLQQKKNS
ncbi:uncharacterized protein LOC121795175 [Salvia splendens]|uniref:uncharacterized protein LOC121795175 n=1 Tax=Salvia splendens TaxID=180675 RepID=UPI001C254F57|nr:uncharacterized protein LOC121795175 [Salvia splendens]